MITPTKTMLLYLIFLVVTGVVSLLNQFVFLYLFRPQSDINEGQLMDFPFASPQF